MFPYITIGDYTGLMAYGFSTFFLAYLRCRPTSLKKQVGEQCDGCGVDDLKPFRPFWVLAAAAVRGKNMAVCGVKVAVYGLKNRFRTPPVVIRQRVPWPILKVMPRCDSLCVSASNEAVISRNESNRMITA